MKASWNLFLMDMKSIGKNWAAIIVIVGLIILPSLYAWLNIEASWDPYAKTDQIPIGIVNEDKGAAVRDQDIHVGDEIVHTLKENRSMDWQFVNRKKAMNKLEYGDYFAVLIIPENFSEKLGTVISAQPKKANVEYYVNEKINAIAPKITEKGASVIVEQISSNFISTVNGIIFEIFNELGIEIEENMPDIEKFEDYIFSLEEKLPEIHTILNNTIVDADRADGLIDKAHRMIARAEQAASNGLQLIDETTHFLANAEKRLDEISPKVKEDVEKIQRMLSQVKEFEDRLDRAKVEFTEERNMSESINRQINDMLQTIGTIEDALIQFQKQDEEPSNNQEIISKSLSRLKQVEGNLGELQDQVNAIDLLLENKQEELNNFFADMKSRTANNIGEISSLIKYYNVSIEPTVRNGVTSAKETLADAKEILLNIQSAIPDVEKMLSRTESNLSEAKKILYYVSGEFPYVNEKVRELAKKLRSIHGETDINEIIELLQNDPEAERGFFAEPIVLKEHRLFSIPNYGTGMTPFYTVLAIWVGGLLLISLISTESHQKEDYTERQVYIGRLLTFVSIGFFQTLIVTLGNMLLLQVEVKEPMWFVLFGILCSFVFMTIVYTFVSVFGNVGKALAIILLVLQIAGSGGTYPVVLLPEFFQVIHPFLPFTYAIDLLREAVGGIVRERVWHDVLSILIFGLLALVLGIFLKESINKHTEKFKKKTKESGLFH
ncbi:phage infection protein [Robertmurraya siralis]|uniref:Phage infection protein n=1 Tax=Robertmurraya siralis TaxID=77777 RepID=A0A919WJ37_9BACI|nr:YhgE/Pip domain-containing protein [Robertmurraya siralis]GIN62656.1 phage infection protein [Robertmurraya siralis]